MFRIPPTLIRGQVRQPEGQMQSLGASQTMLCFYKVDTISYFITASGHRLPKSSSFLDYLFFTSLLPFKERIPGLHIGPRDAAIGQIADDTGQFRDLG